MRTELQRLSTMYKKNVGHLTSGHIVAHAAAKKKRGKQPSLSFMGITDPKKALAAARAIEAIPVIRNAPKQTITIGCKFPAHQMSAPLVSQRFPVVIWERWLTALHLKFGLLKLDGKVYKETYLIEIDTEEGGEEACRLTHNGGFGSHMHHDFAEAGAELARQFCQALGLKVYTELNHWPTLKFVVAAPAKERKQTKPEVFDGRVGTPGLSKAHLEQAIRKAWGNPDWLTITWGHFKNDPFLHTPVNIRGMLVRKALQFAIVGPGLVKTGRKLSAHVRQQILRDLSVQASFRRKGDKYRYNNEKMEFAMKMGM